MIELLALLGRECRLAGFTLPSVSDDILLTFRHGAFDMLAVS